MLLASLTASASSPDQLTIRLVKVPANTPDPASIYLAGDFNGWNSIDGRYRLTPDAQGQYGITLPPGVRGLDKFRLTLAGDLVGKDDKATGLANRPYFVTESDTGTIYVAVLSWRNKSVEVSRGAPVSIIAKVTEPSFAQTDLIGIFALICVIVVPAIIYLLHRRRRSQILLSALDPTSLAECRAKGEELSEAIAEISATSKELERWSRAVGR
jgi:hypothetical protein